MTETQFFWIEEQSEIYAAKNEEEALAHYEYLTGSPASQHGEVSEDTIVWFDEGMTRRGTLRELVSEYNLDVPVQVATSYA